ncbi:MAG TPA: potassium channel protein [Spirochaetota bacterium]|nr:potassium channel protein [Spirochaetota bacterium]HPG49763.1 potassium channel protein [Spirochaetota bacterium]HPN10627.1 potassium channel protein [Spirochaetota bacterium]HQL81012.1 potassium channel protein [Spirochaetota bacterium]
MKKLKLSFALLLLTLVFGITGYHFIEGMSFFDGLYMTVITISTVGFQEVKPLSVPGRVLTLLIISTGIMIAAYTIGTLVRVFIEGELRKTFGRRKVEKKISKLEGHYIICGYGRIGSLVCAELRDHGMECVVIENQPASIERMEADRVLFLPLDATVDGTLMDAGIMRAKGIVTAVGSDADNVFITLTAKGLRPDIFVLARASDEKNEIKLKRAGASRVVSPYLIGGKRMAHVLIRPTVIDFIDSAVTDGNLDLQMEECRIQPTSDLVGKNLVESNLRKDYGVIIVLIKKYGGAMIFNPQSSEVLESDDILVVLGKKDDMRRMSCVM